MFFKKSFRNKVYKLYLRGVDLQSIAIYYNLSVNDVNEIIDYMNEIYY